MRIAVYFGSFDPMHIGHQTFIEEVLKQNLAEKVIVVPTKDYWNKKLHSDVEERLEVIRNLKIDNVITDIRYSTFEYTYELMRFIRKEYTDDTISMMMGADNLPRFDRWKNYEELLEYHFIIMKRDDYDIDMLMHNLGSDNYTILNCDRVDVSSTYIRSNKDKSKHLLAHK